MANAEHVRIVNEGSAAVAEWTRANPRDRLDLRDAEFPRAVLARTNLRRADFSGANLESVNFVECNLRGAKLVGARLHGAYLREANLRDAVLVGSNADYANLTGANLIGACLSRASLDQARFPKASLWGTDLTEVDVSGCRELSKALHFGPSYVSRNTLAVGGNAVPDEFWRGVGLTPWEIAVQALHGDAEVEAVVERVRAAPRAGSRPARSCYVSHDRSDTERANELAARLCERGVRTWCVPRGRRDRDLSGLDYRAHDVQSEIHAAVLAPVSSNADTESWTARESDRLLQARRSGTVDRLWVIAEPESSDVRMSEPEWSTTSPDRLCGDILELASET